MIQLFENKDSKLYQLSKDKKLLYYFPFTTNCLKVDPDERYLDENILFSKEDWEKIRNRKFDPPFKPLRFI